jgi:23S rRNA pseudouridine2605 synthase
MEERLQKIIARAGIASRRHAEELITSGLVTVNGQVVTKLGTKADGEGDHIKVSGKLLQPDTGERVYLLLHKPSEVVSTMSDPEGRASLRTFLHGVPERVYPVGRLEYHASGLVLLTNDGSFANTILQSHGLPQTYQMKLKSLLTFAEIETLQRETGAKIFRQRGKESPWYEVTLSEARQDALRARLFQTGHPVEKIRRVRIGNLDIHGLEPGQFRKISEAEARGLLRAAAHREAYHEAPREAQRDTTVGPLLHQTPVAALHEAPRAGGGEKRERPPFRPKKRWKKPDGREHRDGGPRREGWPKRESSARGQGGPRRFGDSRNEGRPNREKNVRGQGRPPSQGGPRREGWPKRESSARGPSKPRRDGGPTRHGGQGRENNARREGGPRRFGESRNEGRPNRENNVRGEGRPPSQGGPRREGGPGGKNRAGGQGRPHREGGPRYERGPRRGRK